MGTENASQQGGLAAAPAQRPPARRRRAQPRDSRRTSNREHSRPPSSPRLASPGLTSGFQRARLVGGIFLPAAGVIAPRTLGHVARKHEQAITAALDDDERAQLLALLRRLAAEQNLRPGVHPGYRRLGRRA
jgi:hypothetical protein